MHEQQINLIKLMNRIWMWSADLSDISQKKIEERPFTGYFGIKIPFHMSFIENEGKNISIRVFCAERMLYKFSKIIEIYSGKMLDQKFCVAYCILMRPNLFASEVGLVFCEKEWERMRFKNFDSHSYREKTWIDEGSIAEMFQVLLPPNCCEEYFQHCIEDFEEEIRHKGGIHFIYKNLHNEK